jgi:hypothetical protein
VFCLIPFCLSQSSHSFRMWGTDPSDHYSRAGAGGAAARRRICASILESMFAYLRCPRQGHTLHSKYILIQSHCVLAHCIPSSCLCPPIYLSSTWLTPTTRFCQVGTVIRDVLRSIRLDPVLCGSRLSSRPGVGGPQDC